jgi:hypothetical protein
MQLGVGLQLSRAVQSYLQKNFRSRLTQITSISLAVSSPRRADRVRNYAVSLGASRRGTVRARMGAIEMHGATKRRALRNYYPGGV